MTFWLELLAAFAAGGVAAVASLLGAVVYVKRHPQLLWKLAARAMPPASKGAGPGG